MARLQIIIGTTRDGRAADRVVPWVRATAEAHGAFEVEVIDLRDWPLPFFQETFATVGDFADPTYSEPIVKAWNAKIREADAFLVITAEYNHGIPGVLKNAIDNVFVSFGFRNKPLAAVGYSGGLAAATRAIEQLALIAIEAEAVPLRSSVLIPKVAEAFDGSGVPIDPATHVALGIVLDDLAWWAGVLADARGAGELPPPIFRMRAAMSARAAQQLDDAD